MSSDNGGLSCTRSEFASIFHDHDKRVPIDPSRRYFISQTPLLPPDPFLSKKNFHDGPHRPVTVKIAQAKYQRPPTVEAGPDYEPMYNSKQIRSVPKLGKMPKAKRPEAFPPPPDFSLREEELAARSKQIQKLPSHSQGSSVRPAPAKLRSSRSIPKFDATCYEKQRKAAPPDLTPSFVNRQAKVGIFGKVTLKPQSYQSTFVPSALGVRLKRNSM